MSIGLKDIYVDLNNERIGTLHAKEGEAGLRGLRIHLLDNGSRVNADGMKAVFYGKVSNQDNSDTYSKDAELVYAERGIFELIYPSNLLKAGVVKSEIRFYKDDSNISSKTFILNVDKAIVSDDLIEGVDEPSLLNKLLEAGANERDRELAEAKRVGLYNEMIDKKESGYFKGEPGQPGEPGFDGEPGPQGEPGKPGQDGQDGKDGYTPIKGVDYFDGVDGKDGKPGPQGKPGEPGADGTQGEQGVPGKDGADGLNGTDGIDGEQGPVGPPGPQGEPGASSYQTWLNEGNVGTEEDFLRDLRGIYITTEGLESDFITNTKTDYISNMITINKRTMVNKIILPIEEKGSYYISLSGQNVNYGRDLIVAVDKSIMNIQLDEDLILDEGQYEFSISNINNVNWALTNQESFIGSIFSQEYSFYLNGDSLLIPLSMEFETNRNEGPKGQRGMDGWDGNDGESAYEVWFRAYGGTRDEFFEAIKGEQGEPGQPGKPGPQGEPGKDGVDGKGVENKGSFSSNNAIEGYTNEHLSQVNVSQNSSISVEEWFINIGKDGVDNWELINMSYYYDEWFTEYLVNESFVYAEITESGYVSIREISYGESNNLTLYPVKTLRSANPLTQINASGSSHVYGSSSQINASNNSITDGQFTQVNASHGSKADGGTSQVNASSNSNANGDMTQINASYGSKVYGGSSQVNASRDSEVNGEMSQVHASASSVSSAVISQVNASVSVKNDSNFSSAWGYDDGWGANPASTASIKAQIFSETGNIKHSGVINSGHNFTDYAELFPNLTGKEQGYGLIQTIDGFGVRPANKGEQIVGVTSATAGVILGEAPFTWQDRWVKDEWGEIVYHDIPNMFWEPEENETESDRPLVSVMKENPDYDPNMEHSPRQDRPDEWTVVGLVGQVFTRLDKDVKVMDYIEAGNGGVGTTSTSPTSLRVMKITQEYDESKGYKIGFCLLK